MLILPQGSPVQKAALLQLCPAQMHGVITCGEGAGDSPLEMNIMP